MTYREIPDGQEFVVAPDEEFALRFADSTVLAPDRTGLVERLVPGYADLPDTHEGNVEALGMRWDLAQRVAKATREATFLRLLEDGTISASDYSEDEMNTILSHAQYDPCDPFVGEWNDPMPLVVLRTDYQPFTSHPEPTGNVIFIDPSTETTLLDTLAALGYFTLFEVSQDAADALVGG